MLPRQNPLHPYSLYKPKPTIQYYLYPYQRISLKIPFVKLLIKVRYIVIFNIAMQTSDIVGCFLLGIILGIMGQNKKNFWKE